MWVYGSGFPKSLDISKAIDKQSGAPVKIGKAFKVAGEYGNRDLRDPETQGSARDEMRHEPITDEAQQWSGWGTALKPAHEPIVMARKPIEGTVANNVLKHGVGGINIDGCRVESLDSASTSRTPALVADTSTGFGIGYKMGGNGSPLGRFPANFIHDGSEEVLALFPHSTSNSGGKSGTNANPMSWSEQNKERDRGGHDDSGSAARFFYCAKASKAERNAGLQDLPAQFAPTMNNGIGLKEHDPETATPKQNFHPTVKPIALMRYLVRLVTPPNGTVLDPFAGSGTTLVAAILEGFSPVGMEMTADYLPIINGRVAWALAQPQDSEPPTLF
jgi:site-specific DNA-methyltransferase (adenine-specific)